MWRRFWFRTREAAAEYAPEVLHAGWVPLLAAEVVVTAAVVTAPELGFAREGVDDLARELTSAVAGVTTVAAAPIEADIGDLLARFYANQAC